MPEVFLARFPAMIMSVFERSQVFPSAVHEKKPLVPKVDYSKHKFKTINFTVISSHCLNNITFGLVYKLKSVRLISCKNKNTVSNQVAVNKTTCCTNYWPLNYCYRQIRFDYQHTLAPPGQGPQEPDPSDKSLHSVMPR